MVKVLVIKVEACYLCPKLGEGNKKNTFRCILTGKTLDDIKLHIPEWCPLPDEDTSTLKADWDGIAESSTMGCVG